MMKKYILLACCLASAIFVFPHMCSNKVSSPTVKLTLVKNRGGIANLDSPRNIEFGKTYDVAEIYIPYSGDSLNIPGVGMMGFKDDFFVDYTTKMFVPKSEVYVFKISSDDGFRLKIDGEVVMEHPENRPCTESKGEIFLEKGEHVVELNYYQGYGQLCLTATYEKQKGGRTTTMGKHAGGVRFKLPK